MRKRTAIKRTMQQPFFKRGWLQMAGAALCLMFASCMQEETVTSTSQNDNLLRIELKLQGEPYSYSLSEPDENHIEELDILVFRLGGDGKEYYLSSVSVDPSRITTDLGSDPTGRTKSCTVELPAGSDYRTRLVFVANAAEAVRNAPVNSLKEKMLSGIVYTMEEGNWPAENSNDFIPFPMWGESGLFYLTRETTELDHVYLMRTVARVDMKVDDNLESDFKLHEVYLYNRYERGRPVPDADVLEGPPSGLKVLAPTLPSGAAPVQIPKTNGSYPQGQYYPTDAGNLRTVTRHIYLMENAATDLPLETTCFVVGGIYEGGMLRYWRVDLPAQGKNDFSGGFRTFLRNHAYEVVLKAINSEGYSSPDEAFRASWSQIEAEVHGWNLKDVTWADQKRFSLRASPAQFTYLRPGTGSTPGTFEIWTDYDKNENQQGWNGIWEFQGGDNGSWLHVTPAGNEIQGNKDEITTFSFTVDENTTGQDRHAYFKVTAGNLVKYIDIYQTNQVLVVDDTGVYDWVESGQNENPLDGPYRLGVSTSRIDVDQTAQWTGSFLITTDHTKGYQTQIEGSPGWLTIVEDGGEKNTGPVTGQALTFIVADNPNIIPRRAFITIQAGNLEKKVEIVQFEHMRGDIHMGMQWIESSHSAGALDGPYKLGVGHGRYDLPKNANTLIELPIATDFPSGYKAEAIIKPGDETEWFKITGNHSSQNAWPGPVVLTFEVKENNTTGTRVGEICVTAGNLKKYVTVSQSPVVDVNTNTGAGNWEDIPSDDPLHGGYKLALSKQVFRCAADPPGAFLLTVHAEASDPGVQWYAESQDTWITDVTASGDADGTSQTLSFTVRDNLSGLARKGTITVSVIHRGNKLSKVIDVHQLAQNSAQLMAYTTRTDYVTDPLSRQFFTLDNPAMDWAVRLEEGGDPSGILRTLYTTGGKANPSGNENVWFALKSFSASSPPPIGPPYELTFRITSPTGQFSPVLVKIQAGLTP